MTSSVVRPHLPDTGALTEPYEKLLVTDTDPRSTTNVTPRAFRLIQRPGVIRSDNAELAAAC